MGTKPQASGSQEILALLDGFLARLDSVDSFCKKARTAVATARTAFARKGVTTAGAATLSTALQALEKDQSLELPATSQLRTELEPLLQAWRQSLAGGFMTELRQACEVAGLSLAMRGEDFAVGPFRLVLDFKRETAALEYAKAMVCEKLPLEPTALVEEIVRLKTELLEQPVDVRQFRNELEEAMRVALARQKRTAKGDLRVELPAVFREMQFIRQGSGRAGKTAARAYTQARFVYELKTLVQSDDNVKATHPIGLETAVIENTKDPRKSLFVPKDSANGAGEGTYFQAVLLRQPS